MTINKYYLLCTRFLSLSSPRLSCCCGYCRWRRGWGRNSWLLVGSPSVQEGAHEHQDSANPMVQREEVVKVINAHHQADKFPQTKHKTHRKRGQTAQQNKHSIDTDILGNDVQHHVDPYPSDGEVKVVCTQNRDLNSNRITESLWFVPFHQMAPYVWQEE